MLSAQPTPQSEGSQSRKKALSKLFKEIHSAISTYIHLKELTKETGWKVEASSFLQDVKKEADITKNKAINFIFLIFNLI